MNRSLHYSAIFLGAVLAIVAETRELAVLFKVLKPLTTILIILVPILYGQRPRSRYNALIIIALVFCLMGDVFLMYENYFIFGLASFLVGHMIFIWSFVSLKGFRFNVVTLLMLVIYGLLVIAYLYPYLGDLFLPVLFYMMIILAMAWQGINLYLQDRTEHFLWIAIAVILFIFSDSILAVNKFVQPLPFARLLTLGTYWLSVFLLARSAISIQFPVSSR